MLDQIVDWVIQNKEWLFSGAVVVIIPYVIDKLTAKSGDWISQLWKKLGKAKRRNRQELEEQADRRGINPPAESLSALKRTVIQSLL